MARIERNTVSYFPHDAHASNGDTLTVIQSQFGNNGYAVWFKLLEKLAHTENHCIDCDNRQRWKLLVAYLGTDEITTVEILKLLVEMQAIDKELWESKLIWCQNLVDNLADVYRNRKREKPEKPIVIDNNTKTTARNRITTRGNTQSKVNKSKVDNSKVSYGEFANVFLTAEDYSKLIVKFGEKGASTKIDELSEYIKAQPQKAAKYKDHYATILSWDRLDKKRKEATNVGAKEKPQRPKHFDGFEPISADEDEE